MTSKMPERDFSQAKRTGDVPALARIQKENEGKERITIRLDTDVLAWFRDQVKGGGNYQSLINAALRGHIEQNEGTLERTLRRVLREELHRAA
ncbi:MAG: BrnA antitoxin family protein [Pseudoxanthomonas sp.]